jgi:transposase-like protein
MTKKSRRKYTAEFKAEAVKLVTDEGYSISQAARNLDINANCWRDGNSNSPVNQYKASCPPTNGKN